MRQPSLALLVSLFFVSSLFASRNYFEINGFASVEAEHFDSQSLDSVKRWYVINEGDIGPNIQDRDLNHASTASGKSYIEILPDTRASHGDEMIIGENFSNEPGVVGIVSYEINFRNPGEYIVWIRGFSTGGEDDGLHVGINGTWPDSGQRIQICPEKGQWAWTSAQRLPENSCETDRDIRITVPEAGTHTIQFSMREDGFELDKFIMILDEAFEPEGEGLVATYTYSETYAALNERSKNTFRPIRLKSISDFESTSVDGYVPYYKDENRGVLAINAADKSFRGKFAAAQHRFSGKAGTYGLTLFSMQEIDGESEYIVSINGEEVLKTKNSLTKIDYSIHEAHATEDVELKPEDIIQVASAAHTNGLIPENDETAWSRGRWTELMLIDKTPPIRLKAITDFENISVDGFVPFYKDETRGALAVDAANKSYRGKLAAAQHRFTGDAGSYELSLFSMQEIDGECEYIVRVNGAEVLRAKNAPTKIDYSIRASHASENVDLKPGDLIQVTAAVHSNNLILEGDETAWARGRWSELLLIKSE